MRRTYQVCNVRQKWIETSYHFWFNLYFTRTRANVNMVYARHYHPFIYYTEIHTMVFGGHKLNYLRVVSEEEHRCLETILLEIV